MRVVLVIGFCCLLSGRLWAAPPTPPNPPLPQAAAGSAVSTMIPLKDPSGKVTGFHPNPEATTPLSRSQLAGGNGDDANAGLAWKFFQLIFSLALVLGLAYLAIFALKRYGLGGVPGAPGDTRARLIRVLESSSLGQGRMVHVVSVGKRAFLVGTSPQQVTVLSEVTDDEDVEIALTLSRESGLTPMPAFLAQLARIVSREKPLPASPPRKEDR